MVHDKSFMTYGLVVEGGRNNKDMFNSLERLHWRAVRIIFNFPRDILSEHVLAIVKWNLLFHCLKKQL